MSSTSVSIIVGGTVSTSVTFVPAGPFTAPVAPGTIMGSISELPAGWSGVLSLSGANAASFALNGSNLVVDGTALAAGTYNLTITATP